MTLLGRLLNKTYDIVVYNYDIKKVAMALLRSSITVKNPAYLLFYNKLIESKMKKFEEVPFRVMIENTNFCNANCVFCTHRKMERAKGIIEFSLFRNIIDECKSLGINYITIYGFGEPLIDTNFPKKVEYAKSKGIERVTTNTNGFLLDDKKSLEIINAGLDEICISIDAATSGTYKKIQRGLNFNTVEKNILSFIRLRDRLGQEKPIVILSYVEFEMNKRETTQYISKWKNVVDYVSISQIHNWAGDVKVSNISNSTEVRYPCRLLWTDMVVNWNGDVPLCCIDYEGKLILGNVKTLSLKEIWSGKQLMKIREHHKNREFDKISLCARCLYNYHDKSPWWISK